MVRGLDSASKQLEKAKGESQAGSQAGNRPNNRRTTDHEAHNRPDRADGTSKAASMAVREATGTAPSDVADNAIEEALPLLPQGIVENTSEIYVEIANYEIVPLDKLKEYWRVYTTTHRKLYDPTANRLECFWWHVWGSNCRNLSGKTLAKLYENISTGPTFVPLRMPTRRYEGPTFAGYVQPLAPKESKPKEQDESRRLNRGTSDASGTTTSSERATRIPQATHEKRSEDGDLEGDDEDAATGQAAQMKTLSSSSSRPPPPQSILRKPRPSLSGPRLTPRFALPSGEPSEDDESEHPSGADANDSAIVGERARHEDAVASEPGRSDEHQAEPTSSPHGSNKTGVAKRGARASVKSKQAKKKFVVNSAASKRKAVVAKRSGSQSSTASEATATREPHPQPASPHSGQNLIEEEEVEEPDSFSSTASKQDHLVPSSQKQKQQQQESSFPSAKAAGKQPLRSQSQALQQAQQQQTRLLTELPPTTTPPPTQPLSAVAPKAAVPVAAKGPRRPPGVSQKSGLSAASESYTSSVSSSVLEMPTVSRNRQPNQSTGRVKRQSTLPYDMGRGAPAAATPPSLSPLSPLANTGAGAAALAPRLLRSMSQDSYALRQPPGAEDGQLSPALPPVVSSPVVVAPSMVAASGVFSEVEGPDPFDVYAKTGLDESEPGGERPQLRVGGSSGSGSSSNGGGGGGFSYSDPSQMHRPQFTPTRPTQTPRIPFARTRSQLNIILDREKERLGEGSFASWRGSRNGRDNHESSPRD